MKSKKKKPKKRRLFFLVFILLILLAFYIVFETDFFYIKEVLVDNNKVLTDDYIKEKTDINKTHNIFLVEIENIKNNLEKETYIKNAEVKRKLPDKIIINIEERKGIISYDYNNKRYLLDFDGVVLKEIENEENLFKVSSEIKSRVKIGTKINFQESNLKFDEILNISRYIYENNKNLNCNILLKNDNIYCIIDKNTYMKFDIENKIEYQYEFGLDIIETRLDNNQSITGMIDFTKGENPIYIDLKDLEEEI
jgi:cell division protein FtsQ